MVTPPPFPHSVQLENSTTTMTTLTSSVFDTAEINYDPTGQSGS